VTLEFMLDTDTVSFALRGDLGVTESLLARVPSSLCISSISVGELRFGAEKRGSKKLHRLIDVFTRSVQVLPFDEGCANRFGKVAADLAARGRPIGHYDTLIAAHALVAKVVLVTNNTKHFREVTQLHIVNWTSKPTRA
jgi:tRNA(fMet)-specific endonuclease VapC